jgi:hypothetical protein
MTDLDDRLRHDLAVIAREMPMTDLAEASIRGGQQLRLRRASIAATFGVAVIVTAIVVPLTLAGRSAHKPPPQATQPTSHPSSSSPVPPSPNGSKLEESFEVAPPQLFLETGPALPNLPRCKPGQLTSTARTEATPDGVIGVITVSGAATNCSPGVISGPAGLGDGSAAFGLAIEPPPDAATDNRTSANALAIGFAWRGSWCGEPATTVSVKRGGSTLVVPLAGPSPSCDGRSHSLLVDGYQGELGEPLQTAPASWSGLRAHLDVAGVTNGQSVTGVRLTLSNVSSNQIILSPCPAAGSSITSLVVDGTDISGGPRDALGCPDQPRVVPAHGVVNIPLANLRYRQGDPSPAKPGSLVTVRLGIGGLPIVTAHSRVR